MFFNPPKVARFCGLVAFSKLESRLDPQSGCLRKRRCYSNLIPTLGVKMRRFFCLMFLCTATSLSAVAAGLGLQLDQSDQTRAQQILGDGSYGDPDFVWDMSYTHTTSTAGVTDTTHDLVAGSGYATKNMSANLDLNYSRTPEENLMSFGPTASLSYTYFFESPRKKTIDSDPFRPSIKGILELGTLNFVETFGTAARRKLVSRPASGNTTIQQRSVLVGTRIKPWSWMQFKASFTKYSYNKDVNQFLQYIDSSVVARVSSGISNALAGFYDTNGKLELDFYFLENWELDVAESQAHIIADDSNSSTAALTLARTFDPAWTVAVGVKQTTSSDATVGKVNSGMVRVDYDF